MSGYLLSFCVLVYCLRVSQWQGQCRPLNERTLSSCHYCCLCCWCHFIGPWPWNMHHMALHIFSHLTGVSYYMNIAQNGFGNCAKLKPFGWAYCVVNLNETLAMQRNCLAALTVKEIFLGRLTVQKTCEVGWMCQKPTCMGWMCRDYLMGGLPVLGKFVWVNCALRNICWADTF